MSLDSTIRNELVREESSVWLLKGHTRFDYSEGAATESYLRKAFTSVRDLSSDSRELAAWIKDWSSEYHLSPKRAQLLSGFTFDRKSKVLEVGCGCGAITRYLGESFDNVVSVEGSLPRARLARLRTRDLNSVSIICAPFQEIQFTEKFDFIFVVGVFEYSASFVDGDNPYDRVLEYFADMLSPDGVVVIAIENQFGLKYFNAVPEDHLGRPYEGLEGYHRRDARVRTFGKVELERLVRQHFPHVRFFYPYPDYKLPDCVLSSEFLSSRQAGELISQMTSRGHTETARPLWAEAAAALELARNNMLEFFSNSFLVVAGRTGTVKAGFDQLAILFSSGRRDLFSTRTKVIDASGDKWIVSKCTVSGAAPRQAGPIRHIDTETDWIDDFSLRTRVFLRAMSDELDLNAIFSPCRAWVTYLTKAAVSRGNVLMLSGDHIDSIWQNIYVRNAEMDQLEIVDREWIWHSEIPLNVIVIRAVYYFLALQSSASIFGKALESRHSRKLIQRIAEVIDVKLDARDFAQFVALEAKFQNAVVGTSEARTRFYLRLFLADRRALETAIWIRNSGASLISRVTNRFSLFFG